MVLLRMKKTDYPIYPDVSNFKGWNVADVVLGDRYIKTRRRNVNGILSLNIDLGKICRDCQLKSREITL